MHWVRSDALIVAVFVSALRGCFDNFAGRTCHTMTGHAVSDYICHNVILLSITVQAMCGIRMWH